ncbi:HEAT repeat domain-containing protein [Blastopirellula marina]|nr:HEAT repeat domain-containing protein [Blastopirellula marina]
MARILVACLLLAGQIASLGCTAPWTSTMNPWAEDKPDPASHEWDELQMVGDITGVVGMSPANISAFTLVTQLAGTGSDPPPGEARNMVLAEMRIRQVDGIDAVLASPLTALVYAEATIPPGARKGDRIDVRVLAPPETDTTSLEGGWVLDTIMSEMAMLGGRMRKGREIARAVGPIMLDSVVDGNVSDANKIRGTILGGAELRAERPLGIGLVKDHVSIAASTRVSAAINNRFFAYRDGTKQGVANPTSDKFIELSVHPRYQDSIDRYVRVIRFIPIVRDTSARLAFISQAEEELLQHETSQMGAMKLEAIGKEGIEPLKKGLESSDELVRFCAAEALAYLNVPASIEPLTEAARANNGFRYRAMLALGSYDDLDVIDALEGLLNAESAEARYGAFDQLKKRSSELPSIAGQVLPNFVALHKVRSAAAPMVHFRTKDRAEIAIFGSDVRLEGNVLFVGQDGLTIKSTGHRKLKVVRFMAGGEEESRECSTDVVELVQALTDIDCQYGEIVRTLFALRSEGFLTARVEVNAMPRRDRSYIESDEEEQKLPAETAEMLTGNFSQSEEIAEKEDPSELSTSTDGDNTLIPTFD